MKVKHVWCNDGSSSSNKSKLGHIVRSTYTDENGEDKSDIYVDGTIHPMAYREPSQNPGQPTGLTFWNIVDEEGSNC